MNYAYCGHCNFQRPFDWSPCWQCHGAAKLLPEPDPLLPSPGAASTTPLPRQEVAARSALLPGTLDAACSQQAKQSLGGYRQYQEQAPDTGSESRAPAEGSGQINGGEMRGPGCTQQQVLSTVLRSDRNPRSRDMESETDDLYGASDDGHSSHHAPEAERVTSVRSDERSESTFTLDSRSEAMVQTIVARALEERERILEGSRRDVERRDHSRPSSAPTRSPVSSSYPALPGPTPAIATPSYRQLAPVPGPSKKTGSQASQKGHQTAE
ncbi:hypothetical protein PV08_11734 [Exophiala spinifera]|uniref:Uncharacterized protein n=1 Tax=Exophiala spinifera TaxID=91928 RepID=A0A0D2ATC4_9EURO|nr:uncharacterized protein PV08_11734 [Exophiala spinifera]KIW09958.1 hypothetical protein PV08_11734 [Exophiala spinifera]